MHSKSDNIEIVIYEKGNEVVKERFESPISRYQIGLETSGKDGDSIFAWVHLLYWECHKVYLNRDESYTDSSDWIKIKKATSNSINDKDKCFQYAAIVALNHIEIGKNLQRISIIKPFTNTCNWKGINYLSGKDNWKKFQYLLLMCYMLTWIYILPTFQNATQIIKANHCFNDSKLRRMASSYSKKIICIIKRKNIRTWWWFLSSELSSFF